MDTTSYPFGADHDDRDLARVQADLRILPHPCVQQRRGARVRAAVSRSLHRQR